MQRYMWRYLVLAVVLCIVLSLSYLDVQVRYRTSAVEKTLKGRWTLMQGRDSGKNWDDQWSEDESATELFETEERWNSTDNGLQRRLPGALIIGAKKAGTRALLEMLMLHPDVAAQHHEMHFFNNNYEKGLHWYRMQMPLSRDDQLTMEKTPTYLVNPWTPQRLANMSRSVRLLLVVRDPVARALSDYTHRRRKNQLEARSFEDMAFKNASIGLIDTEWNVIRVGQYAEHLEQWLRYFPLRQILVVSGEQLVEDPAQELQEVQKFLGLRPVIGVQHFVFNQKKGFLCMLKSPGKPPICLGESKGFPHPSVAPAALQILRDFYRPFNQEFYRIVGRNFGWS